MKPIRTAIATVATVAALALSDHAYSQSASIAYVLRSDPAIPDITTKEQQAEVMKLFTAHVGLRLAGDPDRYPYEALITEDAVFEFPYAQVESARRIQGRAAIAGTLRKLPRAGSDWKLEEVQLFQTAHPEIFFVAYKLSENGRPLAQRYLARITVRNGQIANYYELWDRSAEAAASTTARHN